ncbi:MAG: sulfotransferase family protein [Ferruginibacter sp.]|uniref:hypothetical protein n=1 Tax=Ferruginibacter sp. TaxID=1940288 RepID=UPI00265A365E|nr:hypothetical protein [Ferruginibacter sp.]MDB5278946.1 sulfotransferase family protein [Ferruginibacter sp.]
MSVSAIDEINDWLPWKLLNDTTEPACNWLYTGDKSFTEPFFDDTISICRRMENNCKSFKPVSSLSLMSEWANAADALSPTAIIFHVSRCGSTLLSQLLSLDENNLALSEVPFFDDILRLPFKNKTYNNLMAARFLKAAVTLYGRKKTGNEKHLFIKTDSWHIHFYESLRSLYPVVPFIFLYRNPWEVVLSQRRQRGMHAVPGVIEPAIFGFSNQQINLHDLDYYMTKVLEGYFNKLIEIVQADKQVLLVNYNEGLDNIFSKMYALLGLEIDVKMRSQLTQRTLFHAKHPHRLFKEENREEKAPTYLSPVLDLYNQLDVIRLTTFR